MNEDIDIVRVTLAGLVVHLLEGMREGGRPLDLVSAQAMLQNPETKEFLENLDPVWLPLPRDGAENRFTFPS
jgi:hypothetical protein